MSVAASGKLREARVAERQKATGAVEKERGPSLSDGVNPGLADTLVGRSSERQPKFAQRNPQPLGEPYLDARAKDTPASQRKERQEKKSNYQTRQHENPDGANWLGTVIKSEPTVIHVARANTATVGAVG